MPIRITMNAWNKLCFITLMATASLAESFVSGTIGYYSRKSSCLQAITSPFKEGWKEQRKKKRGHPNLTHIESIEEFKYEVVDSPVITVVRFYSRYCKSCQASEPLFYKLAFDFRQHRVKFVEVPLTPQTKTLHEALDVVSLPWTHIYHPDAGLVEERRVSKKYIDDVRICLRCYVYGECDLEDAPEGCMNVYGECAVSDDGGVHE